jgi:MSHA biogenesis protein MshM
MYEKFFGLEQKPFGLTPNTSLYFGLPPHEEAVQVLEEALREGEGFIKITGEVGTGKTMVLRLFLSRLTDDFELVYIPNPVLSPDEFKISIARELDIDTANCTTLSLNDDINRKLLEIHAAGRRTVLVIDEVQSISEDTLEAIRLLGNLETEHDKIIQIVLFGQPELDEMLDKQNLRQLRQRIAFSYNLRPLTADETEAYLNYRMLKSGYTGKAVFGRRPARDIFRYSGGIPRLINVIANKSLMLAYGYGVHGVSCSMVREAALDTVSVKKKKRPGLPLYIGLAAFLLLAALGGLVFASGVFE